MYSDNAMSLLTSGGYTIIKWRVLVRTYCTYCRYFFFFSSRRRHTRFDCDWSSDVCSSDLKNSSFTWLMGVQPGSEFGGNSSQSYQLTMSKLDIEQTLGSSPAAPTNLTAVVH